MDIRSTRCTVDIVTPSGYKTAFTSDDIQSDLLRVETQKDLQNACGAFTLSFAPRRVNGETWADRIPMRSLVTITMDRPGVTGMPAVDPVVMVGLTDAHISGEAAQQAVVQRQVTISGREASCVLVDGHLYFHPRLSQSGVLVSPLEAGLLSTGQLLAWKPDLMKDGLDPRENLKIVLEHFIFGGDSTPSATTTGAPAREAVINLQLPGRNLSDILVLNDAAWTTFDDVRVAIGQNTAFAGSVWNYCHVNVDQAFQEFFTRVEAGKSLIHFRAKPFLQTRVKVGTRFDDVPTLTTIAIDDSWILTQQLSRVSHSVFNLFEAYPLGTQNALDTAGYKYWIRPAIISDPTHPSSVQRYGLRVMKVASPYFSAIDTPQTSPHSPVAAAPPLPSSTRIPVEKLSAPKAALATQAAQIAQAQGVPEDMIPSFLANMQVESSWNPNAVSPAGAQGIAQFMPATAAQYGVTDPFNAAQALAGAARYWRYLTGLFGHNPSLVSAGYNAGEGAVKRAGNQVPSFTETQNHVKQVNALAPNYTKRPVVSTPAVPAPPAPAAPPAPLAGSIVDTAERWARMLLAWYEYGPLLFMGRMVVRGHPAYNIGQRLFVNEEREFYIEGVGHTYDFRTSSYTTALRVTRGWYLDGRTEGIGNRIIED